MDLTFTSEGFDHGRLRNRGYHAETQVFRRLGDGVKRRARLHLPHSRTHDNGLVLLWLAHALGRLPAKRRHDGKTEPPLL
jgi:hypothetical protein